MTYQGFIVIFVSVKKLHKISLLFVDYKDKELFNFFLLSDSCDFGYRNDSLFILSYPARILTLDQNDSLKEIYNIDRGGLNSIVLYIDEYNFYIGAESQAPFPYGLIRIKNNEETHVPLENYYVYFVSEIIEHNNNIYVGTDFSNNYLIAKLNNKELEDIGRNRMGACYSMISYNDTLLIGSSGEVISFFNGYWNTFKSKIPTIPNTDLEDKAISLINFDGSIIVGTKHNGILEYNDENNSWENYFSKGLPESLSINLLLQNENQIFALLGMFDFSSTKSKQIYRLNALDK